MDVNNDVAYQLINESLFLLVISLNKILDITK